MQPYPCYELNHPSADRLSQCVNLLPSPQPNTFQLAVATDGKSSYAVLTFKCGDLNWVARVASIGFTADQNPHANYNFSRTAAVNNVSCLNLPLSNWSNVVYQISLGE